MKCHDTQCHSMPVATATVAWNLRAQRDNRTLPRLRKKTASRNGWDSSAYLNQQNASALSAPSVRDNYDYGTA